jgi:hypothetical protein
VRPPSSPSPNEIGRPLRCAGGGPSAAALMICERRPQAAGGRADMGRPLGRPSSFVTLLSFARAATPDAADQVRRRAHPNECAAASTLTPLSVCSLSGSRSLVGVERSQLLLLSLLSLLLLLLLLLLLSPSWAASDKRCRWLSSATSPRQRLGRSPGAN